MNLDSKMLVFDMGRYRNEDGPGIRTIIFLKGCPIRCLWCSNPFGLSTEKQLAFNRTKCVKCNYCVAVCPTGAAQVDADGNYFNDFSKCISCGKCTLKCPNEARKVYGEERTIRELYREVAKDADFYRRGNGGVTVSGGEMLLQWEGVALLLRLCRENFIHTCIETTAFAPWEHLEAVLKYTNLAFIDLKHIDEEKHKKLTGVSNKRILENIRRACEYMEKKQGKVIVRRVIIPGMTDDDENTIKSARFIEDLPGHPEINLLPYHSLGEAKYEMIGMEYTDLLKGTPMLYNRAEIVKHVYELTKEHAPTARVGIGGGDIDLSE